MFGYEVFEIGKKYVFSHKKYQKSMGFKIPNEIELRNVKGIVFIAEQSSHAEVCGKDLIAEWCTKLN